MRSTPGTTAQEREGGLSVIQLVTSTTQEQEVYNNGSMTLLGKHNSKVYSRDIHTRVYRENIYKDDFTIRLVTLANRVTDKDDECYVGIERHSTQQSCILYQGDSITKAKDIMNKVIRDIYLFEHSNATVFIRCICARRLAATYQSGLYTHVILTDIEP